jgi:hypothetical protein
LLERRVIVGPKDFPPTLFGGPAENVMKQLVDNHMGAAADDWADPLITSFPPKIFRLFTDRNMENTGFFEIEELSGGNGYGPNLTVSSQGEVLIEVLKDITHFTEQAYIRNKTNQRVFFEIVETGNDPTIFQFRTYADRRGADRTTSDLVFSSENENITEPYLQTNWAEEINAVYVAGKGEGIERKVWLRRDRVRENQSIWGRREQWHDAGDKRVRQLRRIAKRQLGKGIPERKFFATFLSVEAGETNPRSLYGIDWDFGDLVTVNYGDEQFTAEIRAVYISINSRGEESILGRQSANEA